MTDEDKISFNTKILEKLKRKKMNLIDLSRNITLVK